jgi:putative phage-type endonuclease
MADNLRNADLIPSWGQPGRPVSDIADGAARQEWLNWRRQGIGGSDVATIMGASPWSSLWSLWADKVGLLPASEDNASMEFGRRSEPMLAEYLLDRMPELRITGQQQRFEDLEKPWMRCTVDGIGWAADQFPSSEPEFPIAIIEFKATGQHQWEEIPFHYRCQAQWMMKIVGLRQVIFGVLHMAFGIPRFVTYAEPYDHVLADSLEEQAEAFWTQHVLTGIAPPIDDSAATSDAINAVWPQHDEREQVDLDDIAEEIDALVNVQNAIKRLEESKRSYQNHIKARLGDAKVGLVDGQPAVTWTTQTRTGLDNKKLAADHPDLVHQYQTTTSSRVLRLKKGNTDD